MVQIELPTVERILLTWPPRKINETIETRNSTNRTITMIRHAVAPLLARSDRTDDRAVGESVVEALFGGARDGRDQEDERPHDRDQVH